MPELAEHYSVKRMGIFGSFSDGTYDQNSDIDILVDFEKPVGWKFFTLELYLEKILGRKVDLVTRNALKKQIRDSILSQVKYI
ncbi:MAG: nucleotidyltransferase family protein [Candidatus Delongbacteria bacterium]|nr:nucleotidyltransferase family protein [Candidatus Delongbacteria bacterium]